MDVQTLLLTEKLKHKMRQVICQDWDTIKTSLSTWSVGTNTPSPQNVTFVCSHI
jgi:hypothetical protein